MLGSFCLFISLFFGGDQDIGKHRVRLAPCGEHRIGSYFGAQNVPDRGEQRFGHVAPRVPTAFAQAPVKFPG